jgi:TrmH family RNA methyltransferase
MDEKAICNRVCVVLVRTRNPLNIGAAARAMINFGVMQLRLVQPFDEAWREARSAVGAAAVLGDAREFATVSEAVADCGLVLGTSAVGQRKPAQPVVALPYAMEWMQQRNETEKVALLFGSEKHGLANEELSHCAAILRIPTAAVQNSMNLGQAVAVCLYELARGGDFEDRGRVRGPAAESSDIERVAAGLQRMLIASHYTQQAAAESALLDLRQMLQRWQLTRNDAHSLTGMLAKIEYAVGHGGKS